MKLTFRVLCAALSLGPGLFSATSVLAQEASSRGGQWWWRWYGGGMRDGPRRGDHNAVPEIDAGAGLLAAAAAFATLALVWELRRRRNADHVDQQPSFVTVTTAPSSSTKQP